MVFGGFRPAVTPYPYCGCFVFVEHVRKFLPQVQVKAHTTILATTSRTNLTQTFVNPNKDIAIDELRYIFPLYDGVSVVAFTCTVGSRVIKGVVKERQKAKQEYDEAKAQGEVAGLLEQSLEAADVFTTTIGNVPAGEKIQVDITYLGELKHDAEVDGVRFTIPTQIVPRYGQAESLWEGSNVIQEEGISFSIDAEMPDRSSIKSIQSPSHPISVNIGTTSTTASEEPSLRRASATLQQGATNLDKDFVVQVVATNIGEPSALLETHPTIPNQRALMTTLVPKFKLPAEKPEIVFICDRSGSMGGIIPDLITALEIFLKSLPVGVKFNICSFGSRYSFLWEKSKTYSQETLDQAVRHVKSFAADFGGTQMYQPIEATFQQRYKDMNLEIFLLTDGDIWDQDRLFELINKQVAESKGAVRVFSLGIGAGASSSLVEGVARAGNGFAQTVGNNEKMDKKVVRMLKGALFPHITDYSLEIKYEKADASTDDEEFELVEKIVDGLKIDTEDAGTKTDKADAPKKTISLFDKSAGDDDTDMPDAPDVDSKYDHLPAVPVPRYIQTPGDIPPLFPFNRTTVYVLLSDSAPSQQPKSVLLKGTSRHGPLELEIPITALAEKDSLIHRLAARKEVKELEEGRGWLTHAKDTSGKALKEKHEGHFEDLVEREAVRLGVTYQVGGKWCSFVAVEKNGDVQAKERNLEDPNVGHDANQIDALYSINIGNCTVQTASAKARHKKAFGPMKMSGFSLGRSMHQSAAPASGLFGAVRNRSMPQSSAPGGTAGGALFGSAGSDSASSGGLFGKARGGFGGIFKRKSSNGGGGLFGSQQQGPSTTGTGFMGSFSASSRSPPGTTSAERFGSSGPSQPSSFSQPSATNAAPFGSSSGSLFGSSQGAPTTGGSAFGSTSSSWQPPIHQAAALMPQSAPVDEALLEQYRSEMDFAAAMPLPGEDDFLDADLGQVQKLSDEDESFSLKGASPPVVVDTGKSMQALTTLQKFSGSWSWNADLERVLGIKATTLSTLALPTGVDGHTEKNDILATACAVMFFKTKLQSEKDTWEMLVEKAEGWLDEKVGEEAVKELESLIAKLF
ncbi:Vault poly [Fusarium albosuccineum]|uniref:Vault poly n=1 Tax=Fusarium albosuccineum TaxID=1237068 RepID=A0A8H4P8B6_9HYPO|nr:Vault poly [Fusarium albosuccineum]